MASEYCSWCNTEIEEGRQGFNYYCTPCDDKRSGTTELYCSQSCLVEHENSSVHYDVINS